MPIDPETKAELDKLAAAITAEALGKAIGAALTAHLPGHLKAINDEIAALKATKTEPKTGDDEPGKGKDGKSDPVAVQLAAMRKELDASRQREADAATAAKNASLANAARDALIKHGVPADRVAHAMAFVNAQGVLSYEGDKPGWKGKDQYGADAVLDIDAAAKAFLGTKDGQLYLPPVNAGGTGGGVGNPGSQHNGATTLDALRKTGGGINIGSLLGG